MNTGVELYTKTLISVAYCETIKRWHKSNIIEKKSTLAQILHNSNTANNQLQLLHVNNQCYCFCQIFSKGEDLTCSSLKDITENAREYCEKKGILEQFSTMLSILEIESDDPADTQDHNRYSVLSGDDSFENTYLYLDQENDYILFPEKCTCSGRSSFQNQSINIAFSRQRVILQSHYARESDVEKLCETYVCAREQQHATTKINANNKLVENGMLLAMTTKKKQATTPIGILTYVVNLLHIRNTRRHSKQLLKAKGASCSSGRQLFCIDPGRFCGPVVDTQSLTLPLVAAGASTA
ncbi:uncharacterized protein LOC131994670 [Stomoxys calcitrans]|uniref:uncharacterized protein LOC131994670 n=1 Tax=Stomoxys calcitrans TaxID=35570 RepID=UPI0027E26600|nr:uncharacterized protein LOC131994670 [Stomoxys calcitrans]